MNLALHGFLLQILLSTLYLQHGSLLCSAGEPGYLDFDNLPETNFSCQGKVIGGYYADVEAGCQMFHVCTIGQKDEIMDIKFLCLNGTVFDQETRVCERVDEVDCSKSERFYNLNLELYGNNAVTLSLHESNDDDVDQSDPLDDHQRSTSARPTTTSTTSTTTSKPNKPSTTPSSSSFSHPTGYPQHFQPQPPFPQVHTSQSKSLYDDKNGGYHHQYIFHSGERNNNQPATSYQLFSNQGVSSTTVQPPQVHQIRFSSTSSPRIIHNEPSTVAPLFHATSSTIQTLLNSNANSPALINPIFHNHGIASTTEQFSIHSNNPRDTSEYRDAMEQSIRPLEAIQSTNKGKVSKLTISPVPTVETPRSVQTKTSSQSSQQHRISGTFLSTPSIDETTVRSFYPTPRTSPKPPNTEQVTQHIHVLPPVQIPQLKPHQITINLPPPDLQRIVQNPSSLLPSQSRVIVTAKASVSDESGRPLNTTQLVTLPLPTIPASYDDYKEGDESFDPFYRDVPKIRNRRGTPGRSRRSVGQTKSSMVSFVYGGDSKKTWDDQVEKKDELDLEGKQDFKSIKESLMRFRDILFGEDFDEDAVHGAFEESNLQKAESKKDSLEDLETKASKSFKDREYDEDDAEEKGQKEVSVNLDTKAPDAEEYIDAERNKNDDEGEYDEEHAEEKEKEDIPQHEDTKPSDAEEYVDVESDRDIDEEEISKHDGDHEDEEHVSQNNKGDEEEGEEGKDDEDVSSSVNEKADETSKPREPERVLDIVILNPEEYSKLKSSGQEYFSSSTEPEEISTDVPVVSSTEQTAVATRDNYSEDKKESNPSINPENVPEEVSEVKKIDAERGKTVDEEKPKAIPKRKSSRIRSSRGKISARKKETKIEHEEVAKVPEEKLPVESTETTTVIINSEAEIIDKHIFDEPESQTSKEVDTRAVNSNTGYLKSFQTGKDHDLGKETRKGEVNEYETWQKQFKNLEKGEEQVDSIQEAEEKTPAKIQEHSPEERDIKEELDDSGPVKKLNTSTEEKNVNKEKSSIEVTEAEVTTVFSNENSKDDSHEIKNSRREKSMKFDSFDSSEDISSHGQDKGRKLEGEEEEEEQEENNKSQEYSTMKSEEINSQEYQDSTEASYEFTRENNEEDYQHSEHSEDSTVSTGHDSEEASREAEASEEEDDSTSNVHEDSTEGVLKFTDELPKEKEDASEDKKSLESVENVPHDYVDDNYEPDNYKEKDPPDSNSLSAEKSNKEMQSDAKIENFTEEAVETTTEPLKATLPEETTKNEEELQTTTPPTTTTTTTTTTTRTTTTTARPNPPKLFKPISVRKNYNYIPPTTTPNPVVIKPRLSLLNPKPAKPYKSYNELAPKPVIRKFTSLMRKGTTVPTTTIREEDSTEIMEPVTSTTEASRSEENVLESKLEKDQAKDKDDQDSSPSEQKLPANLEKGEESFTPYPLSRLSTASSTIENTLKESFNTEKPTTLKNFSLLDVEVESTTPALISSSTEPASLTTIEPTGEEESTVESSGDVTGTPEVPSTTEPPVLLETKQEEPVKVELTTVMSRRKSTNLKKQGTFNCLEKEMYRFYGDNRDCRLFHYCSPGFTSKQVLDFRFVCEEGTAFDEESQSCRHDSSKTECSSRQW